MNLLLWLPSLMTHNLAQSQPIFTATVKNRWRRHTGARDKAQDPAISPILCVTKSFLSPAFPAAPLEFSRLSAPLSSACDKSFLAELERTRVGKRFRWQTAHRPRSEQTKISSTSTNKKQHPRNTKERPREICFLSAVTQIVAESCQLDMKALNTVKILLLFCLRIC